jgi:hypothetical protein
MTPTIFRQGNMVRGEITDMDGVRHWAHALNEQDVKTVLEWCCKTKLDQEETDHG